MGFLQSKHRNEHASNKWVSQPRLLQAPLIASMKPTRGIIAALLSGFQTACVLLTLLVFCERLSVLTAAATPLCCSAWQDNRARHAHQNTALLCDMQVVQQTYSHTALQPRWKYVACTSLEGP